MQEIKIDIKLDKAKHGLMMRPKISFFGFVKVRALCRKREGERREKEKKKKEERKKRRRRKKKEEEKFKKAKFGILLWKSCWNISFVMFGTYMLGNTCLSWVRKTLTLQYMCILVGLS